MVEQSYDRLVTRTSRRCNESTKHFNGIQIHLPTWGYTAHREGVELLTIEDNVDFGVRILKNYVGKNYVGQFGVWEGLKRYNGFLAGDTTSEQSAEDYAEKVHRLYDFQ